MSSYLWRFYLEDDVESFRQLLANASYNAWSHTQKGNTGGAGGNAGAPIGSPGAALASSPKLTSKNRKASGWTQAGPVSGGISPKTFATLSLNRSDINSKDAHGLTILHHAASSTSANAILFALALLEVPLLDLYIQDVESGWTALYFGNITIARAVMDRDFSDSLTHINSGAAQNSGGLIKIKDKEGNSPFDLFGATITNRILGHGNIPATLSASADEEYDDRSNDSSSSADGDGSYKRAVKPRVCLDGDDVFTFGSNKNLSLGFGDEDDRQYPERIGLNRPDHLLRRFYLEQLSRKSKCLTARNEEAGESITHFMKPLKTSALPSLIQYRPLNVQDVCMSKLHTAVLSTDPEANLYICGFGPGGRLGTGDEITRFNFVCVEGGGLAGKKVANVGLGQNHTLAISDEGEVFTWGSNAYGQLGYALPKTGLKDDEPVQSLPRQIFGPLKRELVLGVAASRIHSVVNTASSLFTFGKNEGQLGLVDSDARSLDTQVIPRKVAASLFSSAILMVSAIDRATICLLENHDVWVFANYGYAKMSFPLEGFSNYFLKSSMFTTRYDNVPNHISKITSGGDTICAMSRLGDVFTVNVGQKHEPGSTSVSTTNPTKIRNALSQPQRVWSLRKGHMAVRDVDVGQDGSVIICTESGSVWRRVKRVKIGDTSAAGAIDYKPKDYKFSRVPNLTRVIAVRSNTFGAFAAVRKDSDITRTQVNVEGHTLWKDLSYLLPFRGLRAEEEDSETEFPRPRLWTPVTADDDPATIRKAVLTSVNIEADVQELLSKQESTTNLSYNIRIGTTLSDVLIPVHGFILAGRSRVLRQALASFRRAYFYSIPDVLSIEYDKNGQTLILFQGFDFLSILNLILYLYTDTVVDLWHHTRHSPKSASRYRQVRTELMKIASLLDLGSLEPAVRVMVEPSKGMHTDMERAVADIQYFEDGDLDIELDGRDVRVHSDLICQRCPFFEGLFNGRAAGRWLSSRRELLKDPSEAVRVDLKHINPAIFNLVLRHIYADTGEELFDEVVTADLDRFLDVIIEVMSVANELMLDRLSQICQKMLRRFVTTRNVCQLLNAVAACSITEFKNATLEYICLNLEGLLENHLLNDLDDDLLLELDRVVQENQRVCLPFAKSGRTEAQLLEKYPHLPELIDRGRRAKIDSMALQSRLHEDEGRFISSVKAKGGSHDEAEFSPSIEKASRKPSRVTRLASSGPSLRARASATDLMFDMDDDGDQDNTKSAARASSRSRRQGEPHLSESIQYDLDSSTTPKTDTWDDARGKAVPSEIVGSPSPASMPTAYIAIEAAPITAEGAAIEESTSSETTLISNKPWGLSGLTSSKLDMRDIMAQASSSRSSNISLGLSQTSKDDRAAGVFAGRMSQRERKKQQQQQQQQQAEHSTATELPSSPVTPQPAMATPRSPWQAASTGPKISLKDVFGAEQKSSATQLSPMSRKTSIPPLTLQQTVPGGPSAFEKPVVIGPQSSPNITKPSNASSSLSQPLLSRPRPQARQPQTSRATSTSSTPTAIKSIRHNQQPLPAAPSVQLSMADILSQQQTEKDIIKEAVAKRSLQEIQQEQEFQEWWDQESRKVMEEEAK
ncbi:MAG: hypothetical protein M1830_007568, partial [Pleopsidium flavum]